MRSLVVERVDKEISWRDFGYENDYESGVGAEGFEEIGPFAFNADEYEEGHKAGHRSEGNLTIFS